MDNKYLKKCLIALTICTINTNQGHSVRASYPAQNDCYKSDKI